MWLRLPCRTVQVSYSLFKLSAFIFRDHLFFSLLLLFSIHLPVPRPTSPSIVVMKTLVSSQTAQSRALFSPVLLSWIQVPQARSLRLGWKRPVER